jgi:hypothetical protein
MAEVNIVRKNLPKGAFPVTNLELAGGKKALTLVFIKVGAP